MLVRILGLGKTIRRHQSAATQIAKPKTRLGVEILEGREVPAVLYWNPVSPTSLDAGNYLNWRVDTPIGPTADHAPGIYDDLFFNPIPVPFAGEPGSIPPPPLSPDCTFSPSGASQYASIHLVNTYSGTVTFQRDITVGGFEQTCGAIDQTASGQTAALSFTVDESLAVNGAAAGIFTWTGGVLNSGENAGLVNIVGMTNANIGDGTDSSYTTGSDLKLLDGTNLSASGSIILNNGAGLDIGHFCVMQGKPAAGKKWFDLIEGLKPNFDPNGGHKVEGIGFVII